MIPHPVPFLHAGGPGAGPSFVQAQFATSLVITDELPVDDTVPLVSEGAEILSVTVTPQSAASRFLVQAVVFAGAKYYLDLEAISRALAWGAALFRGSTCIDAHAAELVADDHCVNALRLTVLDEPATAAAVTWSVRAGPAQLDESGGPPDSGLKLRINGAYVRLELFPFEDDYILNSRLFGGAAKCTLTVTELA